MKLIERIRGFIGDCLVILGSMCFKFRLEGLGRWLIEHGFRFGLGSDVEVTVRIVWDPKEQCDCGEHENMQEHLRELYEKE